VNQHKWIIRLAPIAVMIAAMFPAKADRLLILPSSPVGRATLIDDRPVTPAAEMGDRVQVSALLQIDFSQPHAVNEFVEQFAASEATYGGSGKPELPTNSAGSGAADATVAALPTFDPTYYFFTGSPVE